MTSRSTIPIAALLAASAGLALFATGCPDQGVVCSEGLTACGTSSCEDLQNDPHNCGGCGVACGVAQVCQQGACTCAPGTTDCGGTCAVLATSGQHCGACANACPATQACEQGSCTANCSLPGVIRCGQSCVNPKTDAFHCGGCNVACPQGQSCHDGACRYDLIAACYWTGQLAPLQAGSFVTGPRLALGSAPQALEAYGRERLLAIDGTDQRLYQADLGSLADLGRSASVGAVPNDVLAAPPYVFVINSVSGTLQVLRESVDGGVAIEADAGVVEEDGGLVDDGGTDTDGGTELDGGTQSDAGTQAPADAGTSPGGSSFVTVAELQLGANSFPQVMTRVESRLYVTLYGGSGAGASAGQQVVEVDIANPASPIELRRFDLGTLPLRAFADGGQTLPRPMGITSRGGVLYVALNNLDPSWGVAGPAYLATVALDGGALGLVELPEDRCLNAGWTQAVGQQIVVSCAGRTDWSSMPPNTTESGLALVGPEDQVLSSVELACPGGSGGEDGGCPAVSLTRFGIKDGVVYVGDQAKGRLFAVGIDGGQLVEQRTYSAGGPLELCPAAQPSGFANVSDVLVVP